MGSTKKHEEIRAEKSKIRQTISELQIEISSLSKVPARVINGSHQEAVAWKEHFAGLKANYFAIAPPRSALLYQAAL